MEQHDQVANLHCTNTAEPLPHGLDESGFLAEEQIPMFSSHGLEERKPTVPNKKYWTITILLFAATWIAFGTGLILNMKSKQMINMEHSRTSAEFNSLQDQDETLNASLNGKINSLQQQVDIFNSRLNGTINSLRPRVDTLNSRLNDLAMRITDQSGWYGIFLKDINTKTLVQDYTPGQWVEEFVDAGEDILLIAELEAGIQEKPSLKLLIFQGRSPMQKQGKIKFLIIFGSGDFPKANS